MGENTVLVHTNITLVISEIAIMQQHTFFFDLLYIYNTSGKDNIQRKTSHSSTLLYKNDLQLKPI